MSVQTQLHALPAHRKLLVGAGALLFVDSFLPWYHLDFGPASLNLSGWHEIGSLAWTLLLLVLLWEGVRLTGAAPLQGRRADLATGIGTLGAVALGAIYVLERLGDGSVGVGLLIGVVLLGVLAVAAVRVFRAGGGRDALRDEVAAARGRGPSA